MHCVNFLGHLGYWQLILYATFIILMICVIDSFLFYQLADTTFAGQDAHYDLIFLGIFIRVLDETLLLPFFVSFQDRVQP